MREPLWLPAVASDHAAKIDSIIVLVHIFMAVIFVGWSAFFLYTLFRFRKKRNPKADYSGVKSHASRYFEVAVVAIEIVLLVGFSIPFWIAEVDALPTPEENPFEVRVIAQQYAWHVHYPGSDGLFGRTDIALINDQTNPLGLDPDDPNSADDVYANNQLHLPVDRQALIHLTARDVIHSFGIPEFRIKQDAIPGMSIPVHFKPIKTTRVFREETGLERRNFEIACAQLCGLGHYRMRGIVIVETEEEVSEWLAGRLAKKQGR